MTGLTPAGAAGAQQAIDHANRVAPGWYDAAISALRAWLLGRGGEFLIEEARCGAAARGLDSPPDMRAWGVVTRKAVQLRMLAPTGRFAPAISSHGSPKPVYRSLVHSH